MAILAGLVAGRGVAALEIGAQTHPPTGRLL
jgi:hypothetical protein